MEGFTDQYTQRKELKGKKKNIITKSSVGHYFMKPNLNTNIPKLKKKALQKDGLLLPPKVGIFQPIMKIDAKKFKEYEQILNRPDGIDQAEFRKIRP